MTEEGRGHAPTNPEVAFALGSAPEAARPGLHALWAVDEALGKVLATGREPMVSRIRLAWWREALERLDREPPLKEPVLQGVAAYLLPAGMAGAELAAMEDGWLAVLGDEPIEQEALDLYAARRGGLLFTFGARLLGGSPDRINEAGEAWALVDLARHSTETHDINAALSASRQRRLPSRWPRPLRPLGMLAVLADRDRRRATGQLEPPGTPPRIARMLRHRLTGW
ncbi:MAG TPA: squalene/phytoene synthase family protein [Allosphingosinicella sp.]|nr:squalene/phytoene synthase family protein [Allosphingosinicella sp.]